MQRFDKKFKEELIKKIESVPRRYGVCIYQPYHKTNKEITRVWFHPELITHIGKKLPDVNSFDILFDTEKKILQFQFGFGLTFLLSGQSKNFCNIHEFFQLLPEWNFVIAETGDSEDGYVATEVLSDDDSISKALGITLYQIDFSQEETQWMWKHNDDV